MQILEEILHASERQREDDLKQQETILATAAAEHAAQERQGRLEELDEVGHYILSPIPKGRALQQRICCSWQDSSFASSPHHKPAASVLIQEAVT